MLVQERSRAALSRRIRPNVTESSSQGEESRKGGGVRSGKQKARIAGANGSGRLSKRRRQLQAAVDDVQQQREQSMESAKPRPALPQLQSGSTGHGDSLFPGGFLRCLVTGCSLESNPFSLQALLETASICWA